MRKGAWVVFLLLVVTLYFLSSIPGLRVLPVLSAVHRAMSRVDLGVAQFSQWFASRLPIDTHELRHIDTVTADFLAYARDNPIIIEFLLRKLAHIFVFFIITIALFFLLHQYLKSSALAVGLAFVGATILAALDEYRQSMVAGRVGSLLDVGIDMIGITIATLLIIFALFLTRSGRHHAVSRSGQQGEKEESASDESTVICQEGDPGARATTGPERDTAQSPEYKSERHPPQ